MEWKKWSTWLKSGVILSALVIIIQATIYLIDNVFFRTQNILSFLNLPVILNIFLLFFAIVSFLTRLFLLYPYNLGYYLKILDTDQIIYGFNVQNYYFVLKFPSVIFVVLFWFVIGAIIGLIVGKVKNKNKGVKR